MSTPSSGLVSQPLPSGRFLYREEEESSLALYGRDDDTGLWITARDLSRPERAAGPFERRDALRALRLANLSIPDGCELGPWQDGLGFFVVRPLPDHLHRWKEVDPARLEPSLSAYDAEHIRGDTERACCAPPTYPPKVSWDVRDGHERALELVHARLPHLVKARLGSLKRAWNGHPRGSLVWALKGYLEPGFYIADIAFTTGK